MGKYKVVRRGVFETNSSSTHSLTIAEGEFVPDLLTVHDGVCVIYPGEFGWEVDRFVDSATKASYALTYIKGLGEGEQHDNLLQLLTDVIRNETGAQSVQYCPNNDFYPWGYIDHQSLDVATQIFESPAILRAFIFNRGSQLETDNDNYI